MINSTHEIFHYPLRRNIKEPAMLPLYLKYLSVESKKAVVMNIWYSLFPIKNIKKVDYVFFGSKYSELIAGLENTVLVIDGVRNKKIIEKHSIYFPIYYFLPRLFSIFRLDPMMEEKTTAKTISEITDLFRRLSPKYLVLPNDSLFLERFLIFCARKAGVRSICIQDGIFQSTTDAEILHGKYADYFFAWSERQKDILIQSGLSSSKVHVLGYPHNIEKSYIPDIKKKKLPICVFGQTWEKCSKALGLKKKEIFNLLRVYLPMYEIIYKPHPGEHSDFLPDNMPIFKGDLFEALNSFDIFISLTSTALIEASLAGKIAIQLYDEAFQCDSFDEVGYCYTISISNFPKIKDFIENINSAYEINQDTIKYNKNISDAFLSIIKKINE